MQRKHLLLYSTLEERGWSRHERVDLYSVLSHDPLGRSCVFVSVILQVSYTFLMFGKVGFLKRRWCYHPHCEPFLS